MAISTRSTGIFLLRMLVDVGSSGLKLKNYARVDEYPIHGKIIFRMYG